MPKISIITPCYKCAKYVRETLDSVRTQKVADWELICVDDGSPDETGRVLDDYLREHCAAVTESERVIKAIGDEDRHPEAPKRILAGELPSGARMTVVHQRNCGVSGARNTALTVATGDWLVFLDGDDLLSPFALKVLDKCIKETPNADIIEGRHVNFNEGQKPDFGRESGQLTVVNVSKKLLCEPFSTCFQRMVFRRGLVKDVAYKGLSCSEEMPYVLRSFIRARVLAKIGTALYAYRVLKGSMSHRGASLEFLESCFDSARCIARILDETDKEVPRELSRVVMNRWMETQVFCVFAVKSAKERSMAWGYWVSKLPRLLQRRKLCTPWQRFVARVCAMAPYRPVAWVLCWCPYWLKQKGVHR